MISCEGICVRLVGMHTYAGSCEGEGRQCLLNLINYDYWDLLVLNKC
jgi:hypothetical protein